VEGLFVQPAREEGRHLGSAIARVASSERVYTIVWLSMSCMYRSVRMISGATG